MLSLIIASAALIASPTGASAELKEVDDEWGDEWEPFSDGPDRPSAVPVLYGERPLTLPTDTFELIFSAGFTQLEPEVGLVNLGAGAGYGVNTRLEVGVVILRLGLSPNRDTGLESPQLFSKYRLLDGAFDLAGHAIAEIPTDADHNQSLGLLSLLRLGSHVRIDSGAYLSLRVLDGWTWHASAFARARINISRHLSAGAGGRIMLPQLDGADVLATLEGSVIYTFATKKSADADLILTVTSPQVALQGRSPEDPALGNYLAVLVQLRWFMANPDDGHDMPF